MSNENYEEDLEVLCCSDCDKTIGWYLPDLTKPFAVCTNCFTKNQIKFEKLKDNSDGL